MNVDRRKKPIPLDYDWLKEKYCVELLTSSEIGALCGRAGRTICYHLKRAGIEARNTKAPRAIYKDKDWLIQNYIIAGRSIGSLAMNCSVSKSVICYNMDNLGIPRRKPRPRILNGLKKCSDCRQVLPIEKFWKKTNSVDGYWHQCKECRKSRETETRKLYRTSPEAKERSRQRFRRYRLNASYRLNSALSSGIRKSLKGNKNGYHWEDLVGYTAEDLKTHLESLWESWMSWDNWGKADSQRKTWQIDHIRPIKSFNIVSSGCGDFKECWALQNLRPLLAIDNILKKDRLVNKPNSI